MDIQMILFDDGKKTNSKIIKVKLEDLPSNDDIISPAPTQDFVEDILVRGQLEPIKLNKTENGFYIISGRRRVKTFRLLQEVEPERFSAINAIVYEVDPRTAALAASAHNNKKADNPMVDLEAIQIITKANPKASKHEISKATGISIPTITKRLKLLNLQPAIQQSVRDGRITIAAAEKAATLPTNLQNELVEKMHKGSGKISLDQVVEVQRVRVEDTAKNLVLPSIEPIINTQKNDIFGYILVDLEFNNILGGLLKTTKEVDNNLNQYKKDYPDIKITVMKVIE